MPVSIACPKCQKKYRLPDAMLGKVVKCQQCGASFKTSPQKRAATQTPAAEDPYRVSEQAISKYGIEGNFPSQSEIFSAPPPPPQAVAGLGNYAGEDPGFGGEDFHLPAAAASVDGNSNPYSAVLNNPALRSSAAKKKRKVNLKPTIDYESYKIARIGMRLLYSAGLYILIASVLLMLLGLAARFAPDMVKPVLANELARNIIGLILRWAIGFGIMANLLVMFVGQVMCMFAPKANERLNAGLAIAVVFGAFTILVIASFSMGVVAAVTGQDATEDSGIAGALAGFAFVGVTFLCWLLAVSSYYFFVTFYRKIGQNIESREVIESARVALIVWLISIGAGFVIGVSAGVYLAFVEDQQTKEMVSQLTAFLNLAMTLATSGACLMMIQTTANKLTAR